MERILVVVFENERQACEGKKALEKLDADGYLTIYRHAVVMKNADGTITERGAMTADHSDSW